MKKVIIIVVSIIILVLCFGGKVIDAINAKQCYGEYYRGVPVTGMINVSWVDIPKDYNEKIELSECAFIGKVKKIKETIYRNGVWINPFIISYDLYTIYEVEIIENIKGSNEINSSVEIMQMGGINKFNKSASLVNGIIRLEDNKIYKFFPQKIELDEKSYLDVTKPCLIENVN